MVYRSMSDSKIKISSISQSDELLETPAAPAAFNWFPGHMKKAAEEVAAKLALVDLVLEIRDARIPLASGNPMLQQSIGDKAHLIILNKLNLADDEKIKQWQAWFKTQPTPYLFINCLENTSLKLIVSKARKIIEDKRKLSSTEAIKPKEKIRFMIVGLPNTGKSTLINQLAKRNATKIADRPGQTRHQIWVKVDEKLELLDTPGIMPPKIESNEQRLWLGAINAVPDGIMPAEGPARFLVEHFLKEKSAVFLSRYKLTSFDHSVDEALVMIATARGCLKPKGLPDLERVYKVVLMDFRNGELGKVSFGDIPPATA